MAGRSFTRRANGGIIGADHINELQVALEADDVRLDAEHNADGTHSSAIARAADVAAVDTRVTTIEESARVSGDLSRTIALGDSITIGNGNYNPADGNYITLGNTSWFTIAALMSGGRIQFVRNAGVFSDTTAMMLARLQADVIDHAPARCIIMAGTNDVSSNLVTADIIGRIGQMVTALRAASIDPVLCTIPPYTTADAGHKGRISEYNLHLIRYAASERVRIIDTYAALVDPATGNYKAGYSDDGVHPNALGAREAAKVVAAHFANDPASQVYATNLVTDPLSVIDNGVMVGDDDSDGVANAWSTYAYGTASATFSLVPMEGTTGNWQQAVITASGSGNGVRFSTAVFPSARMSIGNLVAFSGRVQVEGAEASGMSLHLQIQWRATGDVQIGFQTALAPLAVDLEDGRWYVERVVPASTSYALVNIEAEGGNGTVRLGQVTLVDLDWIGA